MLLICENTITIIRWKTWKIYGALYHRTVFKYVTWYFSKPTNFIVASSTILGFYSLSGRALYYQILRRLEAARLYVLTIVSLCHLTGISAAPLLRSLSSFRAIRIVQARISRFRDFTRSMTTNGKEAQSHGILLMKFRQAVRGTFHHHVMVIGLWEHCFLIEIVWSTVI